MKKAPSPPPAPDPQTTATAQTQSNLQTAIGNARLNRVNQTTPWGSINYTQGDMDANGVPSYSADIRLSPQQQALLDQQQNQQLQRGDVAARLLNRVDSSLGQPLDLTHLHGVNDRGSMYNGAVNAQPQQRQMPPPPQGNPLLPGQGMVGSGMGNQGLGAILTAISKMDPQSLQQLLAGAGAQNQMNPAARSQGPVQAQTTPQPMGQGNNQMSPELMEQMMRNFGRGQQP